MANKPVSDSEIWNQLRLGESGITEALFHWYGQRSFKFAMGYCRWTLDGKPVRIDEDEAWSLVRDAVIVVYDMAHKLQRPLNCQLLTLLCAVIKNKWREQHRRKIPLSMGNSDDRQRHFMRRVVRYALEATEEPCKTKLILRYYYGFGFDEIADIMNYKAATVVSTLISRCREKFRQLITKALSHLDEMDLEPGREYLEDILDDLDAQGGRSKI